MSMGLIYCFYEIKHFNFSGRRCPDHGSQAQSLSFRHHPETCVEKTFSHERQKPHSGVEQNTCVLFASI